MELINEILKWPMIVQGALGSLLFWVVFKIGELSIKTITSKLSKDHELGNFFALTWRATEYKDVNASAFSCAIYGALHYFIKGFLIYILALIVAPLNQVFNTVGLLISAYFLFRSISYIPHTSKFGSQKEAEKKLDKCIKKKKSES